MNSILRSALRAIPRLGTVLQLPGGITADKSAAFGLFALMSNSNAECLTGSVITTAGTNSTLTAAQAAGSLIFLNTGASGAFTITLPTTVALLAALGPTIPTDGSFWKLMVIANNNVGQTGTLTAGDASTTVSGTATIATNTCRIFYLNVASGGTTITIQNLGTMNL